MVNFSQFKTKIECDKNLDAILQLYESKLQFVNHGYQGVNNEILDILNEDQYP